MKINRVQFALVLCCLVTFSLGYAQAAKDRAYDVQNNCGEWTYDVNYLPILKNWLSGTTLRRVPYCSKSVIETIGSNPSSVMPTEFDANGDGVNELALQSGCSATGNCAMVIYERHGKSVRRIFTDVHSVQTFGIQGKKHFGYFDIWTRMHGSWNGGDQVVYRYNGRRYKPIACAAYEYKEIDDGGKTAERPTITPIPCRNLF